MAIPNLAPNYLGQMKSLREQRAENERQRAFESDQASKGFMRTLGRDVLGAALGVGADLAGTKFRDYLAKPERMAAEGTYYPDDDAMGGVSAAIRQAAESRAATELRPQASFGEAAETGFGRRGIETTAPSLGGQRADVLRPPGPAAQPTPAPSSNPMLTPKLEAQFGRVLGAPVAPMAARGMEAETARRPVSPPPMVPRGMEAEAPRRPLPSMQGAAAPQAAPMPPRETREAPGGYQPPRMMPSTTAAIARESGYREAIPSLPSDIRGLAQQAQDVRDKRALELELMRRRLEQEAQQAAAEAAYLESKGASGQMIAQAKARESEALAALRYSQAAAAGKPLTDRRGRVVFQPAQVLTPSGSTETGFRGDFGPPPARPQAPSGGGRGGGGAAQGGEEPTGDVLTIVRQNRDRKGKETGPSQPLRVQEGPQLWRAVATSPIDFGMNAEQAAAYREAYRQYNAALPGARKGDPAAGQTLTAAQGAMRSALLAGQSTYRPEVASVREEIGTSPLDVMRTMRAEDARAVADARAESTRQAQERRERAGAAARAIPAVTDADVTTSEVAQVVKGDPSIGAGFGQYVASVGEGLLDADQFAAAIRGAQPPADLEGPDLDAYNAVRAKASETRSKLEGERRAKAKATVGTAAASAGLTPAEIAADLEAQGLPVPEWARGQGGPAPAPKPALPPAPPARSPTVQAASPDELGRKIEGMSGLTAQQKADLYEREAALRGWE